MNFDFEKTANGYEVVLDNAIIEHFIRKFPDAVRSRERSVWTVLMPRGDNTNNQELMTYLNNVRCTRDGDEEYQYYVYTADGDCEVCVQQSMINDFLTNVTCANFSRRLSAWHLPAGGDDTLDMLKKFSWLASE